MIVARITRLPPVVDTFPVKLLCCTVLYCTGTQISLDPGSALPGASGCWLMHYREVYRVAPPGTAPADHQARSREAAPSDKSLFSLDDDDHEHHHHPSRHILRLAVLGSHPNTYNCVYSFTLDRCTNVTAFESTDLLPACCDSLQLVPPNKKRNSLPIESQVSRKNGWDRTARYLHNHSPHQPTIWWLSPNSDRAGSKPGGRAR